MLNIGVNGLSMRLRDLGELRRNVGDARPGNVALGRKNGDHIGEFLRRVLLVIGDGDTRGECAPVGVCRAEGGRTRGCEIVQLARFDAINNARKNLLGEGVGAYLESFGSLTDSFEYLIERDRLKRTVTLLNSHTIHLFGKVFPGRVALNFTGGRISAFVFRALILLLLLRQQ